MELIFSSGIFRSSETCWFKTTKMLVLSIFEYNGWVVEIMPFILVWAVDVISVLGAICTSAPSAFCSANIRILLYNCASLGIFSV